jgi:DNA invertase Pin-like site-specific DNA recombinase
LLVVAVIIIYKCWFVNNQGVKMSGYAVELIRVSTKRQGASKLGLNSQKAAIKDFCQREGITIIKSFVEVESGAKNSMGRPTLQAALTYAKENNVPIICSTLCRLSRSVHVISGLMVKGVNFIICEFGREVEPFIIHLYASLAEQERGRISSRTKAALHQAKLRGVVLGNPRLDEARLKSNQANKARGDKTYARVLPLLVIAWENEATTLKDYAEALNGFGCLTARGSKWSTGSVGRFVRRARAEGWAI